MLEIRSRIKARRGAYAVATRGTLRLPFEQRRQTRLHTRLVSGEEVTLLLPGGEILRGGDLVVASDGRVIGVEAETERLVQVECDTPAVLARCAYHLGARHVPVEVGDGYLRLAADHALEQLLRGFGARLASVDAPFEPDAGADAVDPSPRHDAAECGHPHHHPHHHHHD
jgi:urease accessory protein